MIKVCLDFLLSYILLVGNRFQSIIPCSDLALLYLLSEQFAERMFNETNYGLIREKS